MADSNQHQSRHHSGELWGLWKLRRYGGNAVLGEREANDLIDAYDGLVEQVQTYRAALEEIAEIIPMVGCLNGSECNKIALGALDG